MKFTPVNRQPIVTGTSVLAIQYKDGIMMAADNLGIFIVSAIQGILFDTIY
jgi:20S proteasome alpha/beta subunit